MRAVAAALAMIVALVGGADAQPIVMLAPPPPTTDPIRSAAEALGEDAAVYAGRYGVTLDEATARLRAQDASAAETARIAATYRDRFAGIVVEHVPAYRIVVHLTGDAPVDDRRIDAGGLSVPVVFRTGAAATRDAVLAAIEAHQAELRAALIDPPGMGVDPASGMLALAVGGDDAALESLPDIAARMSAIAGVQVRAFLLGHDANLTIAGGERLEDIDRVRHRVHRCTSGFLVTDGQRTALATAAHCPDVLDILADDDIRTTLPLIGAWGAGHQDVQLHEVPGTPPARMHAGTDPLALRAVTGRRPRADMRVGDFVCHQGITSGYSCAALRFADYAPPGDLCAGPCPATWAMVDGPDCGHGDSGGPVFLVDVAIGLVKGGSFRSDGSCSAYYYMPLDYLPDGWALATGDAR